MQKNKSFFVFQLDYKAVSSFYSSTVALFIIYFINFLTYGMQLYQQVDQSFKFHNLIPHNAVFFMLTAIILLFIVLSITTYCKGILTNVWSYSLLVLQALAFLYLDNTSSCFSQQLCQNNIIFQIGSIAILIAYIVFVIGTRIFFYYPFYDDQNMLSMRNNFLSIYNFCYKLLFVVIADFQLFDDNQNSKLLIKKTQLVLFASILFYVMTRSLIYCKPLVSKLWETLYCLLLWTSIILFLIPQLEGLSIQNETAGYNEAQSRKKLFFYVWGYTTPFVLIFGYLYRQTNVAWSHCFLNKKHFVSDINTLYLQCSKLKNQLSYLKKSQLKTNDPRFKQLWNLVEVHNGFCDQALCPLRNLKSLKVDRNDDFLQIKRLNKTIQACLQFGKFYLDQQLNQSPNSLDLIIEIAHYDFQALHNKQNGLIVYNMHYSKSQISITQKYALYYLKKKIESLYQQNQMQSNNSAEAELSQFRHNIQVSVSMLAQFWYFLADPKCNLKKLYDLANVLFPLKIGVDNDWKKIEKIKNIQSYNLYAKYLIKMFNDKQKGLKILQQASKIQQQLRNREEIQMGLQGSTNSLVQQNGIIFLQFDGVNSGVMYQVNMGVQKIFGYNKGQLLDRKVNDIMPKIYAKHHDKILQHYQQTNKSIMMNKQRHIVGKSKNGYLFPFTILIKPVRNFYSQTSEVYASVKKQIWVKQIGIITLDQQQNVSEYSASMLSIFPLLFNRSNSPNNSKKKIHIEELIPQYGEMKQVCLKNKQTYEYNIRRSFEMGSKNKQFLQEPALFNVTIQAIYISIVSQPIGYVIKMTRSINSTNFTQMQTMGIGKKTIFQLVSQNFRFTYEIIPNTIFEAATKQLQTGTKLKSIKSLSKINQMNNGTHMISYRGGKVVKSNFIQFLMKKSSNHFDTISSSLMRNDQKFQKVDYGKDIKTKRLQSKVLKEIHLEQENQEFQNNFQDQQNLQREFQGAIRPSELNSILEKQSSNLPITILRIMTFILIVSSTCVYIGQYLTITNFNKNISQNISNKRRFNQLMSQVLYMKTFITYFTNYPQNQTLSDQYVNQINLLDSYLDFHKFQNNVGVVYNDGTTQNIFLTFALNKLVSQVNSLKYINTTLDSINSHVFFISYNTINNITMGLKKQIQQLSKQNSNIQDNVFISNIIYTAAAASFFIICLIIKIVALRMVVKKKTEILQVFFQIPRKSCSNIQKQCQKFIQKLSAQDQDIDMQSVISDLSQPQTQSRTSKQKKRTVMGQQKTTTNYIIATLLLLLFFLSFHIYVIGRNVTTKDIILYSDYTTSMLFSLENSFSLEPNLMNSFVLDSSIPILNSFSHQTVINQNYQNLTKLINKASMIYFNILNLYDRQFQNQFNSLFYQNLCVGKNGTCYDALGQTKGLNSIIFRYYNQIQTKYQALKSYLSNDGIISSTEKANLLSRSSLDTQKNLQFLLKDYWRQFCLNIQTYLQRAASFEQTILIGLVLFLGIFNFTVLLIGWLKYYHVLEQKILATQYILTFIPIDQINRNQKIASFIKNQVLEKRQ